ncbi:negative transcriptional regulator, PaiB family protein [Chroococcidiopsis sp. CCALA 051]|nr:FMN-binding negative transcriptional regulator [Chroococcidiopsidales cyanobacterium LEGE 13417]PSM49018.1 negative transcriptional regulator, PaiB family protein [Chroococcidiopsis sp. CCALA 051]
MYIPSAFREDDPEKLVAFMQAHSFATLVSTTDGLPVASHIPLVVTVQDNVVKLTSHLAKQNPQWQAFGKHESLAIFTGAHAYISPSLYEKRENVPTWNYVAVHAYGIPQIITRAGSPELMDKMMEKTIDTYESEYKAQWHDLSDSYREGMMSGIVGFEMIVTRLQGKYKLSQNRSHTERHNVAHALLESTDPAAREVGEMMQQLEP